MKIAYEDRGFNLLRQFKRAISQWLPQTILFLLTTFIAGYFAELGADPHHDGIMLKPATDVVNGLMLFRDSFTQYGALTTLIQAAAMGLFGVKLLTIRWLTAFFYGLVVLLLWNIWSRFLSKTLTFVACLLWLAMAPYYFLTFLPWSSVYALTFQLASALALIRWVETRNKLRLVETGLWTACAFWCRMPTGLLLLMAVTIALPFIQGNNRSLIRSTIQAWLLVVAGFAGISSMLLAWLAKNDAIKDYWIQNFLYPKAWSDSTGSVLDASLVVHKLLPVTDKLIWSALPVMVSLTLGCFAFRKFRAKESLQTNSVLFLLCIVSLASWAQYFPVNCDRHMYWGATPMIGLSLYTLWRATELKAKWIHLILFIIVTESLYQPIVLARYTFALQTIATKNTYVKVIKPDVLKGMIVPPYLAEKVAEMDRILNHFVVKSTDVKLMVDGPNAMYSTFVENNHNVDPVYVDWGLLSPFYPAHRKNRMDALMMSQTLLLGIIGDPTILTKYEKISEFPAFGESGIAFNIYVPKSLLATGGLPLVTPAN